MTWVRASAATLALALISAALLAFVSRTPERVRRAEPGSEASDPALGARFADEDIARHGSYRGPSYLAFALGIVVEVVALVLLARGPLRGLVTAVSEWPGGWVTRAAVAALVAALFLFLASLPLSYVRGYAMEHAWGLSTQGLSSWVLDKLRSLGVALVLSVIAALAFFGIVRWQPRTWWIWGWAAFTGLTALLTFLWPVVIAPLFNRFTPLEDGSLRRRVIALADEAGIGIDEVLVSDASRRTTAENAYVAGLGATKQLVLYDNLIQAGDDDETAFVVAHELGHRVENHVVKNVAIASAGLLAGFALLAWLSHRDWMWSWAGATDPADVAALPALLLFATVAGLLVAPLESTISRRHEARADRIALELTDDADTAVRVFRRLAFANLADLRPPRFAVWTLFSHPPIPERISAAMAESSDTS